MKLTAIVPRTVDKEIEMKIYLNYHINGELTLESHDGKCMQVLARLRPDGSFITYENCHFAKAIEG